MACQKRRSAAFVRSLFALREQHGHCEGPRLYKDGRPMIKGYDLQRWDIKSGGSATKARSDGCQSYLASTLSVFMLQQKRRTKPTQWYRGVGGRNEAHHIKPTDF
jgi:hypothetical protein